MDQPNFGPVVQRLIFGLRARALRNSAQLDLSGAASAIGMTKDKLSKIENGVLGTTPAEVERMITRFGVLGEAAAELRELAKQARRKAAPERVGDWGRQYVALERDATEVRMVYPEIPGAMLTAECALEHLVRSPVVLPAQAEGMAQAREVRGNHMLAATSQRVSVILGEEALHREVGGRDGLRRQLERVQLFAEQPHISVRVYPLSAGSAAGLSCPFTLLWIEPANVRIAYTENLTGSDYLKTTGAYAAAFDDASTRVLSEDATRELLERRINDL
ncbi:MAG: helix-turn-helix transcriptional regulator [Umezawaea sp.]